jgi:hypothetical protein
LESCLDLDNEFLEEVRLLLLLLLLLLGCFADLLDLFANLFAALFTAEE